MKRPPRREAFSYTFHIHVVQSGIAADLEVEGVFLHAHLQQVEAHAVLGRIRGRFPDPSVLKHSPKMGGCHDGERNVHPAIEVKNLISESTMRYVFR